MDIINLVKHEEDRLIAYRRHFHQNPELSGKEFETLAYIKEELRSFNIDYIEVADGGILGFIDSGKAGKTVLLRADIDALPINEDPCNTNGLPKPCVSLNPGVQHACGHDAHTAILLVAGKILNENRDAFKGKIVLCFERGEEANGNVFYLLKYFEAKKMTFDSCFGLHVGNFVDAEVGSVVVKEGPFMAGMTNFQITLIGKGGHGSRPDLANNPIDCFCSINETFAKLRMRTVDPQAALTYSIGQVSAGNKSNVIPDELRFAGTIRYFNNLIGKNFMQSMQDVINATALAYKCQVNYDEVSKMGYPLVNNKQCTEIAKTAFSELFPDVISSEALLGTESFSFYQQRTPGVFAMLCTNNPKKGISTGNHTAKFDVDEDVLYKGVCCHIAYAIAFLNKNTNIEYTPNAMSIDQIMADCGKKLQ